MPIRMYHSKQIFLIGILNRRVLFKKSNHNIYIYIYYTSLTTNTSLKTRISVQYNYFIHFQLIFFIQSELNEICS